MAAKKAKKLTLLTLTDFHTFYLASHIIHCTGNMRDRDIERLCTIVESFAKRLLAHTKKSLCCELRHTASGGDTENSWFINRSDSQEDVEKFWEDTTNGSELIQKYGSIEEFEKRRMAQDLSFSEMASLCEGLEWDYDYGGRAWAKIARTAEQIEKMLPVFSSNLGSVAVLVDHIIDLEHNNDLYLEDCCTFNVSAFLDRKTTEMEPKDFTKAPSTLKGLYKRYGKLTGTGV